MLPDYNVRRLCESFVGANGRSPERGLGWISAFYAKKRTLGTGQSPFSLSCSLERSELSNMFFLDSSQPCNLRHGTWNCSSSVQRLISREAELASKSPPAEGSIATWAVLAQPCVPACSSPALRPPMLFGALRLLIVTSLPRTSEPH
jgi:hypothetical protein